MKTMSHVIFYIAWVAHGLALDSAGVTVGTWQYWVATLMMAAACFFLPANWDRSHE
jgi:hypothetical protein